MFVEYGVDLNARAITYYGYNPKPVNPSAIEIAIEHGEISLVEYFLSKGADPTNQHRFDEPNKVSTKPYNISTTAVYDAIKHNRLDILILFANYGVNLDGICYEREHSPYPQKKLTPLQAAIDLKNKDITAFLLSIGANM